MPRIRLVLAFGLPDPDRLSTTLLWSVLGHIGLAIGVLIYKSLPSQAAERDTAYFVRLAAPAGIARGHDSGAPAAAAPRPLVPIEKPAPSQKPPPSKASVPAEKEPRRPPRNVTPSAAPREAENNAPSSPSGPSAADTAPQGAADHAPAPPGDGQDGSSGGIGATSFGEGDFHYDWYRGAIEAKLRAAWHRPIAERSELEKASVSFTITREGAVQNVAIAEPSGSTVLDLSVVRAVYDAVPLPPLPKSWKSDSVHVTMEFQLVPDAP